jgi:hypothetical protein
MQPTASPPTIKINMHELEKAAGTLPAIAMILGACGLIEPEPIPSAEFGRITAVIRDSAWWADVRPDSVVAYYDAGTGHLVVFGVRVNARGPETILSLTTCGPPSPKAYPFVSTWSGPYGAAAWLLGADASLWEPLAVAGETDSYMYLLFGSTGESGDSLVVEEFDLNAGRIRGFFQFGARSAGGSNILRARGRFYGRVESQPGRCSLDIGT